MIKKQVIPFFLISSLWVIEFGWGTNKNTSDVVRASIIRIKKQEKKDQDKSLKPYLTAARKVLTKNHNFNNYNFEAKIRNFEKEISARLEILGKPAPVNATNIAHVVKTIEEIDALNKLYDNRLGYVKNFVLDRGGEKALKTIKFRKKFENQIRQLGKLNTNPPKGQAENEFKKLKLRKKIYTTRGKINALKGVYDPTINTMKQSIQRKINALSPEISEKIKARLHDKNLRIKGIIRTIQNRGNRDQKEQSRLQNITNLGEQIARETSPETLNNLIKERDKRVNELLHMNPEIQAKSYELDAEIIKIYTIINKRYPDNILDKQKALTNEIKKLTFQLHDEFYKLRSNGEVNSDKLEKLRASCVQKAAELNTMSVPSLSNENDEKNSIISQDTATPYLRGTPPKNSLSLINAFDKLAALKEEIKELKIKGDNTNLKELINREKELENEINKKLQIT